MEKMIDEIAKLICTYPQCDNYNKIGGCKIAECQIVDKAEKIYKQGYRKQVEAEWIDLHKGKYENPLYVCSACRKGAYLKVEADELNNPKTVQALTDYCPHCGAKMKGSDGEK